MKHQSPQRLLAWACPILLTNFLLAASPVFAQPSAWTMDKKYDTTVAADGSEVLDTKTGLIWRRCAEGFDWKPEATNDNGTKGNCQSGSSQSTFTYEGALARAKQQATAPDKAWRVPNIRELASISMPGEKNQPTIDTAAFPSSYGAKFWSSTPYVWDETNVKRVRVINFSRGTDNLQDRSIGGIWLRLVR
jgi:hypothetical protein